MTPIEALDKLTLVPGDADANRRIQALAQCFSHLHKSDDAHLLSIFAGKDTSWNAPELDGMPLARRWMQQESEPGRPPALFYSTHLDLMRSAGDGIERAAAYVGISPQTLNQVPGADGGLTGSSRSEALIDALVNEWDSSRLCEIFWKDQRLKTASQAIYGLSLEDDNYLVFVGPGDIDGPCIAILGEQPFESILYAEGTPRDPGGESLPETEEAYGYLIEGKSLVPASWWPDLVSDELHTLLRATFMQMAIPGEPLDITSPNRTPHWRDVPLLPITLDHAQPE